MRSTPSAVAPLALCNMSLPEQLEHLARLTQAGSLTAEEFRAAKASLISQSGVVPSSPAPSDHASELQRRFLRPKRLGTLRSMTMSSCFSPIDDQIKQSIENASTFGLICALLLPFPLQLMGHWSTVSAASGELEVGQHISRMPSLNEAVHAIGYLSFGFFLIGTCSSIVLALYAGFFRVGANGSFAVDLSSLLAVGITCFLIGLYLLLAMLVATTFNLTHPALAIGITILVMLAYFCFLRVAVRIAVKHAPLEMYHTPAWFRMYSALVSPSILNTKALRSAAAARAATLAAISSSPQVQASWMDSTLANWADRHTT